MEMESCEIGDTKLSVMDPKTQHTASDPDPIELPPEVWTEVFKPLSTRQLLRCRLVCRRWKDIVDGSSSLRRKMSITFRKKLPTNPRNLPPASTVHFMDMEITTVGSWWPLLGQGLTELELYCKIQLNVLLRMLKDTPNLKKIELFFVKLGGELIAPKDLRLAKVEHLSLHGIENGQILEVFRKLCCNLKTLDITWDLSDGEIVSSQEVANIMVDSQNTLQELDITGSDEILMEMIKLDRMKLKNLMLTVNDDVSNELLVEFFRNQQSLEFLQIQPNPSYEISADRKKIHEICWMLPNLKKVSLYLGLETGPMDLTKLPSLTKLQKLSLNGDDCDGCYRCGDSDGCERAALNLIFSESEHCNITELQLANFDLSQGWSEKYFQQLLAKLPNLRDLEILQCSIDTWPSIFRMLGSLSCLEKLTMMDAHPNDTTRCSHVDDLVNLRYLRIYGGKTSPELLASILSRCPGLRQLVLSVKKRAISKEVLRVICQKLTQLSDLTVSKRILSKDDETYLRANCHSLRELQIW